jgi:transcriptional regulator with XRE-family HTH domain
MRRGLTQDELAQASGVSVHTVRVIEQDAGGHPRMSTLHKLATALKVTTSALMTPGVPEPHQVPPDQWDDVRDALYRPSPGDSEPPDPAGILQVLASCLPDLAVNRYTAVRAVLPGLLRDAAALGAEGHQVQSRVYNMTGWLLTQTRQWDDALTACRLARDTAADRLDDASAVNTQAWCLLRQGRLAEAADLAARAADDLEPRRISRATPAELAGWGKLWLYVGNAAVRDNQPGIAGNALSLARTAAARIGRETVIDSSTTRTFGPASVEMIAAECAALEEKPDKALAIAERIPKAGLLHVQSASRLRHRLDLASAHAQLRDYGEATGVMTGLREEAPEWLAQQQYGRDILSGMVQRYPRRLPDEVRELADAVRLPL